MPDAAAGGVYNTLAGILPRQRHESRMHLLEGSSSRPVGTARRQRVPPGPPAPGAAGTLGFLPCSGVLSLCHLLGPLFRACLFRAPHSEPSSPLSDGASLPYRESLPNIPNTFFCSYFLLTQVLHSPLFSKPWSSHPQPSQRLLLPPEVGEPRLWSCTHRGVVLGIHLTMGVITRKLLYSQGLSFLICKMDTMPVSRGCREGDMR